jgi:uncharacterized protein (TIGR01777 family)
VEPGHPVKVAIVGGSGLLGRHLSAGLRDRRDDVMVLSRDPDRARRGINSDIGVARWSSADPAGLAEILRNVDGVINLAGVPVGPLPWTPGRRRAIVASRLDATRSIVAAIGSLPIDERPRVLVNASGTDSYTGRDSAPATESTPSSDGFLARVCLAWEAEAGRARRFGVRVPLIRIGFVLARDAPVLRLFALPFRLHLGGRLGNGRQWMSWIHVDDLVSLLMLALDDERVDGIVNAVTPTPVRESRVAAAIAIALGRRCWLAIPAPLIRVAMGEASILALGSRRVVPTRASELGFRFRWLDLEAAMKDVLQPEARSGGLLRSGNAP